MPAELTNATAIAAGFQHGLAVKGDGTVAAWGRNNFGQCTVPADATNMWDVAAGVYHSMALRRDGTVVCWGDNSHGECTVPAGLSNVVAIAAGGNPMYDSRYSLALKSDGTVVIWGAGAALWPVVGMSNVVAIAAGAHHALGIRTGPKTPVFVYQPQDQYQVAGGTATFQARATGVYGVGYQWQNGGVDLPGETNASLTLISVQAANVGVYRVIASNEAGSVTSGEATFHLITAPVISMKNPSTNPTAYYQTEVPLSIAATAPGTDHGFPVSYQWQRNGTDISSATGPSYTLLATNGGQYSVIVSNAAGSTTATWDITTDYGTLAYYLSTNTAAYTNGHLPDANSMQLVSNWTNACYTNDTMHLLTNAVWSTNCWLAGVKGLSATALGISNNFGAQTLLTMVSPRHYMRATHTGVPQGPIAFLDTNNVIHWRTRLEQVYVAGDTSVGILDEDLPSSVGYLPVLSPDFTNYLPRSAWMPVQGVGMNQDMKVFGTPMTFQDSYSVLWYSTNAALFGLTPHWNVFIRGGDSSDPQRIIVSNQMVLITSNWQAVTNGFGAGPNYAFQFTAINQAMHYLSTNNSVGSDHQLTTLSLTNWPAIR